MDSILELTKKKIGLAGEDSSFDDDIIVEINAALAVAYQLGALKEPFRIESDEETWDQLEADNSVLSMLQSYVYIKAKLVFDPPSSSTILQAYETRASELEWRMNAEIDPEEDTTDE